MNIYYTSILLYLTALHCLSQNTCTSVASGDWDQASSWSCNYAATIPDASVEIINIDASHTISIVGNEFAGSFGPPAAVQVNIDGTLFFAPPFPPTLLHLPTGSEIYVSATGTIDAGNWLSNNDSGLIRIAGNTVWFPFAGIGSGDLNGPGKLDQNSNGALPIVLFEYNLDVNSNNVTVNWSTLTEENNDYFVIQRSNDGINFIDLATISGAGTSYEMSEYSFIDNNPHYGVNYYRLTQTDYDGTSEIFKVVVAEFHGENESIVIIQKKDSLTHLKIYNNLDEENTGWVTDVLGHKSKKFQIKPGGNNIELSNITSKSGIYIICVSNTAGKILKTQRILIK